MVRPAAGLRHGLGDGRSAVSRRAIARGTDEGAVVAAHAAGRVLPIGGGTVDGYLGALLARVGRYWLLVLAVTVVAVLGALAATARTPTTYVGRTSLIVSSND